MKFRGDVEGLRAVAVIAVVLYHCGIPHLAGGYLGVDVFFVLSGFLISSLMFGEIESTRRLSFAAFYGRRARRLLPAATMVIAVTLIAGWYVLSPLAWHDLLGDALSATTYTVNWRFAAQSTDYFQSALPPSALQHYWSLAVEEQFYLVWPLVIWLLAGARLRRARVAGGIGVIVGVSFVLSLVLTVRNQPWAFFGLQTRMWQLGAGALLAAAWPHIGRVPLVVRRVAPIAGLAAIVVGVVVFDEATPWPGTAALVPTLGTLAVLLGADDGPVAKVLGQRPAVWVGARSYSWYLWHWPALVLFAAWRGAELSPALAVVVALGSLVAGAIGFRYVEQPIRHRRSFVRSPRRSLVVGLSLSATCLLGVLTLRATAEHVDATGPAVTAGALPGPDELPALLEAAAAVDDVPGNLTPSLSDARSDLPSVYGLGCHADVPDVEPKHCDLGDPDGDATVVLIGDSHAAQWVPALEQLAAESGVHLVPMTKSGCPVFDVPVFNSILNRVYTECDEWRDNVLAAVASMHPDAVIVTQASTYTPADTGGQDAGDVILNGYVDVLHALSSSTSSVVVLSDTPYPASDIPDCLSAHLHDATACTTGRDQALAHRLTDVERDAAEQAGAAYVAVDDLVCGPVRCPVVVGNLLVYRDNSHLSTPYVRWVAPGLASRLGAPWLADGDG